MISIGYGFTSVPLSIMELNTSANLSIFSREGIEDTGVQPSKPHCKVSRSGR